MLALLATQQQQCEVQLAAEIEVLKSALASKHSQLMAMESACLQESDRQVELEDSIIAWQDKYERLYESHKRVQKLNQNLEDKLLKLVDRNSGERAQLTTDVATLSVRLAQANYNIQSLKREIDRYKTDISVAIQLLQCKPDSFVSPKLSSLPIEIQSKVATYMRLETNSHSDSEGSTSGVGMATTNSYHVLPASDSPPPLCPFPPTAMVYSMRGLGKYGNQDNAGGNKPSATHHHHLQHQQSQQEATLVVPLGANAGVTANSTDNLLLGVESRSGGGALTGTAAAAAGAAGAAGVPPNGQNVVSPSVMAKFLEDELKSSDALLGMSSIKHCDTCVCTRMASAGAAESLSVHNSTNNRSSGSLLLADLLGSEQRSYSVATQTLIRGETNNSLCLRCNSNLNSPSHNNSPYIMKLIKSSDSVISETKSSVSDYLTTPDKVSPSGAGGGGGGAGEKTNGDSAASGDGGSVAMAGHVDVLSSSTSSSNNDHSEPRSMLVPTKKDDLMVNPILGHHRLSIDRNASLSSGLEHQGTGKGSSYTPGKFSGLVVTKKPSAAPPLDTFKATKLASASGVTAPQTTPTSTTSTAGGGAGEQSKFANDSPSYIIKDTDQMSGHHTTPKSSVGGHGAGLGLQSKFGGTSGGSGSVGSGLYHHAIGSTNSLWSRTSSKDPEKDGAKMFEIFNRNLIKTIKAENPKMSGPRICALRIQNGSSNILLDNLLDDALEGNDSKPTTPVMYTRRAKFLDEELLLDDDPSIGLNGAIKTTPLPTATSSDSTAITASSSKSVPIVTPAKGPPGGASGVSSAPDQAGELGMAGSSLSKATANTLYRVDEGGGGDGGAAGKQQSCNMSTTTSPHSSDRLFTIGEEVSNLLINTKLPTSAITAKPRPDISVNKLDGIDVTSKKSCTHSSSISSEIDIQESAILRRQQLSRVAEWVQNNSKMGNPLESNTESDSEPLLLPNGAPAGGHTLTDSLNNNNSSSTSGSVFPIATKGAAPARTALPGTRHLMQSFPRTTHNNNNNNISSSTSNNNMAINQRNSNQSVTPFAQIGTNQSTTIGGGGLDYNSNGTQLQTASGLGAIRKGSYGTTGMRQQHRGGDSTGSLTEALLDEANRIVLEAESRRLETQAEEDRRDRLLDYEEDDRNSVDLAQMEYNVKQFLLKQNEWSTVHTRRQSLISSTSSVRAATAAPGVTSGPRISEARESSKGLFPGTAVPQSVASNPYRHRSNSSSNNNNNNNNNMYPINPHRTETNL
ncbi:mucin-19-like isoform X7 [Anopheles albimanus]|uniref:mucin-19-like isoform X7 n=1 Tax=Anopheles albimanus TaxID=7167 RepID=UPI001641AF56|nr:mucin-19-like isoform X7 [Anopheles albimanus]